MFQNSYGIQANFTHVEHILELNPPGTLGHICPMIYASLISSRCVARIDDRR